MEIIKNNDIAKLDWSKQNYLSNRQANQILVGNKISKRVLDKMKINQKVSDKKTYLINLKKILIRYCHY